MQAADTIRGMTILNRIIEKLGARKAGDSAADHSEAQMLIASLLALVARSDGGMSAEESTRMVNLLSRRFGLGSDEASELIAHSVAELPNDEHLDDVLESINNELSGTQKEELMFIVLCVIAADDKKDAAEMKLFNKLIDTFRLPDATIQKMYEGHFDGLFY